MQNGLPSNMPLGVQRQMAKLEKDTYKTRKLEGRPKHGQTSFTILGVGILSWFLTMLAIALPEWRANWIGVLGYPYKRSWGLFMVSGMEAKMHHEAMSDMCRYYSQLAIGGMCASPICLWYRSKCQIYMDMATTSYTTGFFMFLAAIIHTLCMIWTARMTPRMIRWAAVWWIGCILIHVSIMMFWWLMTTESFASLDSESLYPEPDFSFSFYAEVLTVMCLGVNCSMGITLMKMWPETSSSDDDSDEEDEDEDDEFLKGPMGKPGVWNPAMGGPPPPGMMPPGMPPPGAPGGPPMMGPGGPPMQMMGPPDGAPMQMMGPPGQPQMQQMDAGPPMQQQFGPPDGQQGFPQGPPQQQFGPPDGQQQMPPPHSVPDGWNPGGPPGAPGGFPGGPPPGAPGFDPNQGGFPQQGGPPPQQFAPGPQF